MMTIPSTFRVGNQPRGGRRQLTVKRHHELRQCVKQRCGTRRRTLSGIVIIVVVTVAISTIMDTLYNSINTITRTAGYKVSAATTTTKKKTAASATTNTDTNTSIYVDAEVAEDECWSIIWLVPQRWEANYIDDILQPTKSRTLLRICQDSRRNSTTSTTNKKVDYGNVQGADALKLLSSLTIGKRQQQHQEDQQDHNHHYLHDHLRENVFRNTIVVTSIRMGNHTLNTLVLDQIQKLRGTTSRKGKTVLFLISEEANPYPSWFSYLPNFPFHIPSNDAGDGDRPCSNQRSKFNQLIRYVDLVLRNYWTKDCAQYQQQPSANHPEIIFLPLLVTEMAYSTGYNKHCSSFRSHVQIQTKQAATPASNGTKSNIDTEESLQFGKSPSDRRTFLYFSSTHTMRHRSSFVDTVVGLAASSSSSPSSYSNNRRFRRYRDNSFIVNDYHNTNETLWNDGDGRNRPRRIILKYPKGVDDDDDDDGGNNNHESEVLQSHQRKPPHSEYAEALSDVQYAAVLKGNVDETWRFTESLFCGAIPLLQESVWEYYSHWLPPPLMRLLPSYSTRHDLKSTLVKLAKQSQSDYEDHAIAVRSAATEWITKTRDYVLESIME